MIFSYVPKLENYRFCMPKIFHQVSLYFSCILWVTLIVISLFFQISVSPKLLSTSWWNKWANTRFTDLFHQAIEMSGSLWAGWANSQSVVGASNRLLQQLDCTAAKKGGSENSKQLLSCLKKLPVEAIERASDNLVFVCYLKKRLPKLSLS